MQEIDYYSYYKTYIAAIENTLQDLLPAEDQQPGRIHEIMRYCVFPGGKRFRPLLSLAACEAVGGNWREALIPAASIELIHCYSLVHDDLPALDNDDLRRGQPTCHKHYGEAMAILAGDALLTYAFQLLTHVKSPEVALELLGEISTASGTYGMIGGQVADLSVSKEDLNLPMLEFINVHKTGKLIKASTVIGGIIARSSAEDRNRLLRYGELLGLAFQSVDDLLDGDGYMQMMESKELHGKVRDLIADAKREIKPFGVRADKLIKLADYLLTRIPQGNHVDKVD